ncbi:hypothetical protein [Moraxella sp. FZLJ2109]|uniref:hypothetical protein n=1 Tax=Moraxella sp. FZLJ2109 TaxID=2961890 RepID=UPI0020C8AFA1|nr:hypothetical protein [Moraxella sp. FZLJ2109]UTO21496.1 hypothetical protein NKU06_06525 [Moraxella sp. FZLJ2109]UTO21504.1 hypothetical protein NKU06_06565 [Moraxella sp. FZLJ2109]UTO21534.1 hypothetical protein NKU06_06715 [Moraxella sp. FZLJ2109]UTO21546.1 hypothetical protein NKU06_06775 [Moraxella sp. FZLJ2109]UTO21558.1 hypothetical protein NKU06_06835 [Moraxella sp. FZLJ2109]
MAWLKAWHGCMVWRGLRLGMGAWFGVAQQSAPSQHCPTLNNCQSCHRLAWVGCNE